MKIKWASFAVTCVSFLALGLHEEFDLCNGDLTQRASPNWDESELNHTENYCLNMEGKGTLTPLTLKPATTLTRDCSRMIHNRIIIGEEFARLDSPMMSIHAFREALSAAEQIADKTLIREDYQRALSGIASMYFMVSDYDNALKYQLKLLESLPTCEDPTMKATLLSDLGVTYYSLQNYPKAIFFSKKSLDVSSTHRDPPTRNSALMTLSLSHTNLKDYARALESIGQIWKECGGDCDEKTMAEIKFALGVFHFELHHIAKAEEFFQSSFNISKRMGQIRLEVQNIDYLTQLCLERNDLWCAKDYLNYAHRLANSNVLLKSELIKLYKRAFEYDEKTRDYSSMVNHQQKYIYLKDGFYNEEFSNDLVEVELEYLAQENLSKIEFQRQILLANKKILARERWIIIAICCIVVCLFYLVLVLRSANKQKSLINSLLSRQMLEHTRLLARKREASLRNSHETDLIVAKACTEIRSLTSTINGLLHISINRTQGSMGKDAWSPVLAIIIREVGHLLRKLENLGNGTRSGVG